MLAAEASQAAGPSAPTVRGAVFTEPAARQPAPPAAGPPFEPADSSPSYAGTGSHRDRPRGPRKLLLWSAGICVVLSLWLIMSHVAREAGLGTRIEPRSEPSAPLPASPAAFASPSAVVPTLNRNKIHPPSNVDMARAHWCEIPPQGEDAEAGITNLLAKINANACAEMQANGVDITKGCAWGVSREHVDELLRQAAQDWEDGVYHCKDHKVE
jgi:hypothetical protein